MITRKKSRIPIARIFEQLLKKETNCGTDPATQSRIQRSQPQQHGWQHPQSWQSLDQGRMEKFVILKLGPMTTKARLVILILWNTFICDATVVFQAARTHLHVSCSPFKGFGLAWWRNQCERQGLWHETLRTSHFLASAQSVWTPHFVAQERVVQLKHSTPTCHCLATEGYVMQLEWSASPTCTHCVALNSTSTHGRVPQRLRQDQVRKLDQPQRAIPRRARICYMAQHLSPTS